MALSERPNRGTRLQCDMSGIMGIVLGVLRIHGHGTILSSNGVMAHGEVHGDSLHGIHRGVHGRLEVGIRMSAFTSHGVLEIKEAQTILASLNHRALKGATRQDQMDNSAALSMLRRMIGITGKVEALSGPEGLEVFKAWIQERYLEVEVGKIADALTTFFRRLKRRPSQSVREFNSMFDRAYSRLLEIDCKLPEVAKAWAYMSALGLTNSEELSLLASVNNEYHTGRLQKAAVLHEKSLRPAWQPRRSFDPKDSKANGVRGAFLTGIEEDDEDLEQSAEGSGDLLVPEEAAQELHEAFVAQESAKARFREVAKASQDAHVTTSSRDDSSGAVGNIVQVAYEVGTEPEAKLLAITDTACSKSVTGQSWLDSYIQTARQAGVKVEFIDAQDDFRFGASKLFRSTYQATIHFSIGGRCFMVRAAVVQGEVPLLLSRSVLSGLGMVYDVENGTAQFRHLSIANHRLSSTETGHPAIVVRPQNIPSFHMPAPDKWVKGELFIIPKPMQGYTVHMTLNPEASDVQDTSSHVDADSTEHASPTQGKSTDAEKDSINAKIFYPKKIHSFVENFLSAEPMNAEIFVRWWSQTKLTKDFWIETGSSLIRIHVVPRRGLFNPSSWVTSQVEVKGIWEMTKVELLERACSLGCLVHPTWTVVEIRQVVSEKQRQLTGEDSVPKGLSSMTLAQLKTTCAELQVAMPSNPTKGQLLRLIRDQTQAPGNTVVPFGRHRGRLFSEVPESYLRWTMEETQRNGDNASPDLIRLSNYAKSRLEPQEKEMPYDPEFNAKIPYVASEGEEISSLGSWSMAMSPEGITKGKGYSSPNKDLPLAPKSLAKRRNPVERQEKNRMDQDVPDDVKAEAATTDPVPGGSDGPGNQFLISLNYTNQSTSLTGLRSFGFPVGVDSHGPRDPTSEPWEQEHRTRPKKSVRRSLWKGAQRASALFTLGLAAATSFLSEVLPRGHGPEHATLLEVGGIDLTCDAVENGDTVLEPLSWNDFLDGTQVERIDENILTLKPHVVWIQGQGKGAEATERLHQTLECQLSTGGMFVYQDHDGDAFWETDFFRMLKETYKHSIAEREGDWILRVGERSSEVEHNLLSQEAQVTSHEDPRGSGEHVHSPAAEIKFEGNVPKHVQAALTRLHQNLGHPAVHDMARHLRYAGADEAVIKACKAMRCEVCHRTRHTTASRPATLPSLMDMNQLVSIDVFHVFDINRTRHEILSVIDHATTFHLACKLNGHSSTEFCKKFTQLWGNVFGAPGTISVDLESGLVGGIAQYAEFHGCKVRTSAGQAHWQQGVIERHGLWFQEILKRVIDEKSVTSEDIDLAIQSVNSAKNELRRRHGFSPNQAVFGKDPKAPEELCSGGDEERFIELMSGDRQRQKEVGIRTAARMAFFRTQLDTKLRRSLLQRARVKRGGYKVGELVCFYRIEKVATKRGQWRGPGTIIGAEGGNWWVSFGGRCYLCAEEHLRPSTSEELGDLLSTRIARDDLEKLLNLDPDDPSTYQDGGDVEMDGNLDEDPGQAPSQEVDMDFQYDLEAEGVNQDPPAPDSEPASASSQPVLRRSLAGSSEPPPVSKRVRKKGPGGQGQSAMMLKKCFTDRSLEKQYEKELPWRVIPESEHQAFRDAEARQFQEHLDHQALLPLSIEESREIRATVPPERILTSRYAYRDKNYSRRKIDPSVGWKHKARLVIGGHRDPDAHMLQTDAPTVNRLTVLTLLQLVASRRGSQKWQAAAGDITAAFLNGDLLERELFLSQPKTGLKDLHPEQLLRITKGVFGLPDSPRKWWRRFRDTVLGIRLEYQGVTYGFCQNPLDPCLFQLSKVDAHGESNDPLAYVAVHVDDLLVVGSPEVNKLVRTSLSSAFPVGDWEIDSFEYLGSHISVSDQGVFFSQEAYTSSRLFEIAVDRDQRGEDQATYEQKVDNQSLIGALSWLASQSRPDLQCSVSLAQQLQQNPTVEDIRFTNLIAKRALEHKDKGIWLRPLDLDRLEILVYHDAAWANAKLGGEEGFRLSQADHELGIMRDTPYDLKERKAKRANSCVASQLGTLVLLTDRDNYDRGGDVTSIIDWKSGASQRVCRSTFGAETSVCTEAVEVGQYIRSYIDSILRGTLKRVESLAGSRLRCITDCKSLFDHLHKEGIPRIPTDKRLAIDLSALRQNFDLERVGEKAPLYWVPTGFQLADILTKPMSADSWWSSILGSCRLPFVHPSKEMP
ncbi:RE2 [Symbiodinium microadriaticum]|nr:RE2 [Symbiodinium microadriaticum]